MTDRRGGTRRFKLHLSIAMATLVATLALAPAVGAARPATGCELHPGDTTVTWQSLRGQVETIEVRWLDETFTVIQTTTVPVSRGRALYTQQTPENAVEFGVDFIDDTGNVIAVTGGGCF